MRLRINYGFTKVAKFRK